jgi:exopolysaccharide biosynthesis polyprenyl glycosylphosphotransferase
LTDPTTELALDEHVEELLDAAAEAPSAPAVPGRRFTRERSKNGNGAANGNGSVGALDLPSVRRASRAVRDDQSRPISEGARDGTVLGRDQLHRRLLACADVVSLVLAVIVGIELAGSGSPTIYALAVAPLAVVAAKVAGLYDRDEHLVHKTTLDEVPSLFQVAIASTLTIWLLDDVFASEPLSKLQVVVMLALFFVLMGVVRPLARRTAQQLAPPERILVVGGADDARRINDKICSPTRPCRAEVVGRVPAEREPRAGRGDDVLGILADLDFVLAAHKVDRVVICPHGETPNDMLDTIRLVKGLGAKVSVMPRLFEVVGSSVEFDDLGGMTLLGLRRYELTNSSAFLKRALDVTGALGGLVFLAPFFAIVALIIKLTSTGPVFFKQSRVGRGGETFAMLKFRTMYDGADQMKKELVDRNEADGFFKIAEDPRVTPVGRLLRRASLDELPQLINVLRGEMSLVGPRPLVREEDARIEGWFRRRLDVTPGMTGAWQVLGSSRVPMREMVTIDYLYRANWSLWNDIKIMLRTVPHVLRRHGL